MVPDRDPSFLATRSMPAIPPIVQSDKMRHSASDSGLLPKSNSLFAKMRQSLSMSTGMFRKHSPGSTNHQPSHRAAPPGFVPTVVSSAVGIRPSFYW